MREFKSIDWVRVKGRGWIAVTRIAPSDELPAPGSNVVIDGNEYTVRNVEYSMNLTYPPVRDENVGIVVSSPPLHKYLKG